MSVKKLKICILVSIFVAFCNHLFAQQHYFPFYSKKQYFTLKGTAKGLDGFYLYLSYRGWNENRIWDSVMVKNNAFVFSGYLVGQWKSYLTTKNTFRTKLDKNLTIPLYLEPGKMNINVTIDKFCDALLKGSKTHNQYLLMERKKIPELRKFNTFQKTYDSLEILSSKNIDSTNFIISPTLVKRKEKIEHYLDSVSSIIFQINKDFAMLYPNAIASVVILDEIKDSCNTIDLECMYDNLIVENKQSPWGKKVLAEIKRRKTAIKGLTCPIFWAVDTNGDTVKNSDFKDKYIVLTFWKNDYEDSYKTLFEIKSMYDKYTDKCVSFVNISADKDGKMWHEIVLDKNRAHWRDILMIDNDSLALNNIFGIKYFATSLVVNPDGNIQERFDNFGINTISKLSTCLENIFK